MGINYNPKIVKEGLVLCLDAANPRSYGGSGTTWYDLSGNGINGTLVNGPTYSVDNLGSIQFDGVNDKVTFPNVSVDTSSGITVELWFKTSSSTKYQDIFVLKDIYGVWIVTQSEYIRTGFQTTSGYIQSPTTYTVDTWYNIVLMGSGTSNYQFINGEQTGTGNRTVPSSVNFNSARIANVDGDRASEYLVGNVAVCKFYNRALTSDEIKQNFNATRSRFGL